MMMVPVGCWPGPLGFWKHRALGNPVRGPGDGAVTNDHKGHTHPCAATPHCHTGCLRRCQPSPNTDLLRVQRP